ncbi:hypothetical protein HJFPF1_08836 [Paramyrothecium foliicola]|nr:hypothetical protein HJFPF1_08836 [Paramyrothecium foliicola]
MRGEAGSSQPATSTQSTTGGQGDFVRLHITPFDQDLLKIVLPPSVLPSARNISFHTIETFPEKRYGYVELPPMEAEKIKKKLNGSVLKGAKVKVDKARPQEEIVPTGDADLPEKKRKKKSKDDSSGSKKRKRDPDVMEGVSLNGRKVKRGWTEPQEYKRKKKSKKDDDAKSKEKEKRKQLKSKYTDQEECLLKTRIPPNATATLPQSEEPKKKKKKGKGREVIVHEFEKTTKFPSFLKSTVAAADNKSAVDFVEGKGWVDADGNVVEAVKDDPRASVKARPKKVVEKKPVVESDDDSTSSSGMSSESESDEEEEEDESASEDEESEKETPKLEIKTPQKKTELNGSGDQRLPQIVTPTSALKVDSARPMSSSSSRSLTIKIPPPITPSATKVHPLEALYKRQQTGGNADETPAQEAPFSFFGGADNEADEAGEKPSELLPMTPYSRQDFEWRNVRSAAPTPDTAHPSRMRNFWAPEGEDEDMDEAPELNGSQVRADEEEQEADEDAEEEEEGDGKEDAPAQGQPGASDFQNWFWENRRDLNRSWMTRRKTAAKEKRHRENKARASKAI